MCATGAVMALATGVVGLWALPVFSLPLLLAQLSLRRNALVRITYRQAIAYRQTIAYLARATEIVGYTPAGHARRVALSLVDPVPAGATAGLPAAEQRRIAPLGGVVVRRTGVAAEVAVVVERQADPYREQPVGARIVRAVNAYEEKVREAGPEGPLRALEELRLGTARNHHPEVVEPLARVLSRDCLTLPAVG